MFTANYVTRKLKSFMFKVCKQETELVLDIQTHFFFL